MKLPKANGKPKRSRYRVSKDRRSKSPKLESLDWKTTCDGKNVNVETKVKSGSWKRKPLRRNSLSGGSPMKNKDTGQTCSSSQFRPGILYSDVLFSGENPSTLVRVRGPTPDQAGSYVKIPKTHSRKRAPPTSTEFEKDKHNLKRSNHSSDVMFPEKKEAGENRGTPMVNLNDLAECTQRLMKRMNIEIPSWNLTDFGTFNDIPKFVCQFDDYNYLACEKVAFVGLRLASDGKFKF